MKKLLKLVPAFAMLLVAAILVSTSTYAWFSMNNTVTATGMKIKAKAEAGLLINEVQTAVDDYWDESATALAQPGTALVPTSTTSGAKWFHANSRIVSDEAGATANTASPNLAGDYAELTLTAADTAVTPGAEGTRKAAYSIYYVNNNGTDGYQANSTDTAYYVMYKYYLKVSNEGGLSGLAARTANTQNVAIKEVKVTAEDGDSDTTNARSTDLNKALRVGIKMGGKMYIYAPVYGTGATSAEYFAVTSVDNTGTTQAITTENVIPFATDAKTYTALNALNGISGEGTEVDIYVWFEGEDDYCQSDKITEVLDNLSVEVLFSLETIGTTAPTAITKNEF